MLQNISSSTATTRILDNNRKIKIAANRQVGMVYSIPDFTMLSVKVIEVFGNNIEFIVRQDGRKIYASQVRKGVASVSIPLHKGGTISVIIKNGNLLEKKVIMLTVKTQNIDSLENYIRERIINVKAIGDGAILWYESRNKRKRRFPFTNRGWICTPTKKPCWNGRHSKYPKDSNRWEPEPWKSLRFGINRQHYNQFCYKSTGTGQNATFMIKTISDPQCTKNYSMFVVRGYVDRKTGKIHRVMIR